MITAKRLASYFDHTQLRAYAVYADFEKLCNEARRYGFAMVAINPAPVRLCCELLKDSPVHVGAAVGFPLGQNTIAVKQAETLDEGGACLKKGAVAIPADLEPLLFQGDIGFVR